MKAVRLPALVAVLAAPVLAALASPSCAAPGDGPALEAAAARLAEAGRALAAARGDPATRDGALVEAIAAYETALSALRGVVIGAGAHERALALALSDRRDRIMRLTGALMALERTPPPVRALHPDGPLAAARAGTMLASALPALRAEAEALAAELEALDAARSLRRQGLSSLAAGLVALEAGHEDLGARIARHAPAPPSAADSETAAALAAVARDSETLTALAAALAAAPGGPAATAAGEVPLERLLWPVKGRIVRAFNAPDASGARRPGLVLGAPPLSVVVAPAAGLVRYAGPFLEYGYVVALETDDGAVIVLAGLAQLGVAAGAPVARGELLGLLGGRNLDLEEYVMLPEAETGAGALETLYVEVRSGRGPVDPAPLLATTDG